MDTDQAAADGNVAAPDSTEPGQVEVGEVTGSELETGEIETGELEAGEIETGEMEAGEMTTGDFEPGEMRTGDLEAGEIETGEMETGDLEAGEVVADGGDADEEGEIILEGTADTVTALAGSTATMAEKLERMKVRGTCTGCVWLVLILMLNFSAVDGPVRAGGVCRWCVQVVCAGGVQVVQHAC